MKQPRYCLRPDREEPLREPEHTVYYYLVDPVAQDVLSSSTGRRLLVSLAVIRRVERFTLSLLVPIELTPYIYGRLLPAVYIGSSIKAKILRGAGSTSL